jgi:hypothetical protein
VSALLSIMHRQILFSLNHASSDSFFSQSCIVRFFFSKEKRKDEANPKWSRSKTTLYHKKLVSIIYEIWSMKKLATYNTLKL